jgi:hypothetical protein
MAELTITVAVTTGTQYLTGSTSNIFTFDGSQPASFTFPWVASGTLRLDQSGSSNDFHPLIFSTSNSTDLATMKAGIISSGVTYYLDGSSSQSDYTNTTTFNAATTRYIEIAPASQTDFYFACWVHGIGMGGIMDITQDTWGSLSWNQGKWGEQNDDIIAPSGFSITASLGETTEYNHAGWGRDTYSEGSWGVEGTNITVTPTGLSMTGHLNGDGTASFPNTGWGRDFYGEEPWGDSFDPIFNATGFTITAALGELPYAQSESGWGRDEWGYGNWGENTTTVVVTESFGMTAGFGPSGWGIAPWDEQISWGGDLALTTTQLSIAALTGIEATASLGTATIGRLDMIFGITGPAAMSAGIGTPNINNGADHSQGLASLLSTMSLGTPTIEIGHTLSGFEATMSLGSPAIVNEELVILTTSLLVTGSLGSTTVTDMAIGVSGYSITGSVGTPIVTDMQVGISGLEATLSLGSGGVAPLHYKDVDITGNTSYTYVEHSA